MIFNLLLFLLVFLSTGYFTFLAFRNTRLLFQQIEKERTKHSVNEENNGANNLLLEKDYYESENKNQQANNYEEEQDYSLKYCSNTV